MPSLPTRKKSSKSQPKTRRRARSASPRTNLWAQLLKAVDTQDAQKVQRLLSQGVLIHPDHKQTKPQQAMIFTRKTIRKAIPMFAVERALQTGAPNPILEILENAMNPDGTMAFDFTPHNIPPDFFVRSWWSLSVLELLLRNGFDEHINIQSENGNTILINLVADGIDPTLENAERHVLLEQGKALINRFFSLGADVNIQNNLGMDAVIASTGHPVLDVYWEGAGDGLPLPQYLRAILDNLIQYRIRYDFNNSAFESDDQNADASTAIEDLEFNQVHHPTPAHTEALQMLREHRQKQESKPTKSAAAKAPTKKSPTKKSPT
jgi:hypothetical protein